MASRHHGRMTKPKTPKRVALYARVSTDQQTTANQLEALRESAARLGWEVVAEFKDHGISGAKGREGRPQFDRMLKGVTRGEYDLVAAWSVDRLGRSLQDLVGFLEDLHAKGCDLYLHQQGLDTSTPSGRAMFQMMGVFAEFERGMIQERVRAGLARARVQGTKSGRAIGRPGVGEEVEARIRELRSEGMGMLRIAKAAGCGVSVVQRVLSEVPAG
jgi:DNA invertase Pin-like site-specific DNA recombinase